MENTVLITGVSSGIGEAIAQTCIDSGYRVFGTLRTAVDAARCQAKWGGLFVPLLVDLRDGAALHQAVVTVDAALAGRPLNVIVNNAGIVMPAPLQLQPLDDIQAMLEVNVLAPVRVIQAFLPLLGADSAGIRPKIINISSVSGQLAMPFLGGYTASKHALEGLSYSLRRELLLLGIDVVVVAPGSVRTPIWAKAATPNFFPGSCYEQPFKKFIAISLAGEKKGLSPLAIAKLVLNIMQAKRPKVRYNPVPQKFANFYLPKLLPARLLDRLLFVLLAEGKSG